MQCECRWTCNHHDATWIGSRSKEDPWAWRPDKRRCALPANGDLYIRVICTNCKDFRIFTLCPDCYARTGEWITYKAGYYCEVCLLLIRSQEAWSRYKEAK